MLKPPKKGSTEWVSLYKYLKKRFDDLESPTEEQKQLLEACEDVHVGVLHLPKEDRESFRFKYEQIRRDEIRKRFEMRKKYSKEQAQELYESVDDPTQYSPEGFKEVSALLRSFVSDYINGVKGVEGFGEDYVPNQGEKLEKTKREEIVRVFDHFGLLADLQVIVLNLQSITTEQVLS